MIVAEPGGLQNALDRSQGTGETVVARNGATFRPENITVPSGVTFDARSCKMEANGGGHTLFECESGGVVLGGFIDARSSWGGTAFRIRDAEGLTGPLGTLVWGRWNGSRAVHIRPSSEASNLRFWINAHHITEGIDMDARNGAIRGGTMYSVTGKAMWGCRKRGTNPIENTTVYAHNQPRRDQALRQWWIDNPNARNNWLEGYLWDAHRMQRPWVVEIDRADGGNVYANAMGRTQDQNNQYFKFVDNSGSDNRVISLVNMKDGLGSQFPNNRFTTADILRKAGFSVGPGGGGGGGGGGGTGGTIGAGDAALLGMFLWYMSKKD